MIGQLTVPTSESSIPQVAEGVFVARAEVADWMVEPVSHRCLTRLLDCDYPRWRDARSEDFRARFAATRHFAKSVVARVADLPVEDIELLRCTSGRPSFVVRGSGCSRVVDANLSHTRDSAVMAVSTRGPVGVDVEAQNRNLDDGDFARAICHDEELGEYERAQPSERQWLLLELWTWKEATTKALGTGLGTAFPLLRTDIRRGTVTDDRDQTWRIHALSGGGYRVAIARRQED
ncbi:4'-phosphopantetheinyl transferase family protein [Mycobacteroides abscessus]|uniref:4'-phosphopantetheinyl transferase family protein n=1 Tax=Mycobacteroides abscessus TaxID=36809 RepID=UPI000D3E1378|nr:4'-phosphopantetheinyl transferase superfamily protein [Mycobacteroides abscessus]PVA30674.1 4-phosphopantetheinyl transferase [Mycobacteroides abscessus]PVA49583.1 4-phosphopantetheinyl transferase [Mycobacteroides abscessus]RIQ90309.1 4-phosphopantetheinyl transferase [Mycobacteroides abscessus]RIR01747.1 4-phosphopantetheinyl transferase [Mycobacteroides abscessus]